jgi:hypothetical protein
MPDSSSDEALVVCLRRVQTKVLPLQSKGGANPVEGIFPVGKAGNPLAERAQTEGWVEEVKEARTVTTRRQNREQTTTRNVSIGWRLSAKGQQFLAEKDSPKAVLEALLPLVKQLIDRKPQAAPDLTAFNATVKKATEECVGAIEKAFAGLQETIEAAFEKMQAVVVAAAPAAPASDHGSVLRAIQTVVGRLQSPAPVHMPEAKLASTPPVQVAPPPAPVGEKIATPVPVPSPANAPISSETLRKTLKDVYDYLCRFEEFQSKLVELRRLYHEAKRHLSALTVEQFHEEMEALNREWKVELHILNEVMLAKERELAIWKNDRLYYYAFWK